MTKHYDKNFRNEIDKDVPIADKIEPQGGLKALSESSSTIRITSISEKDGAGRTIKKSRWS